jgi:site-specific DNA-methyltransferase (adenine-specific)
VQGIVPLKENDIHLGDSFKLLKRVEPESVRLLLTDPPYNVTQENNLRTMGRRGIDFEWDGDFDQVGWLHLGVRTLMPWGSIIIFNDWKNLGQIAEALRVLGMEVKRCFQWYKSNPMPRNTKRLPVQRCEYALWAVKPSTQRPKWVFNPDPSKGYEDGIFSYPIQKDPLHKTKKPDDMFEEIIRMFSEPDDLILDPFSGTGTLAIAADRAGRRHISMELDVLFYYYAKVCLERDRKRRLNEAASRASKKELHV